MSRISQDFINNIGYLYEEMSIQENDFLNEESQYYDAEAAELVEDILSTISVSMVYEGYSAEGIIGFLADSSEQDIIEKYLDYDENILVESTISEEYIIEQLEIFDTAINEGLGSLIGKVAKGAVSLAGRVASKPARKKITNIIQNSKRPEVARRRIQNLAQKEARKGNVGGYSSTKSPVEGGKPMSGKQSGELLSKAKLSQATQKVKDIAKGAKGALPGIAKGALLAGTGVLAGYTGAKLGSGGKNSAPSGSKKELPSGAKDDFLKGSALAKLGGKEGRIKNGEFRTMSWSPESKKRYAAATKGSAKPSPSAPSTPSSTPSAVAAKPSGGSSTKPAAKPSATKPQTADEKMKEWARKNPELAAKVKPGESGYEAISQVREKPSSYEKQDQTPTQGPKTTPEQDKSFAQEAEKAAKEFQDKTKKEKSTTAKESYEPYDILLDYLIGRGHAETIEEAHYIMLEMDQSAVGAVMEEYEDYLIAEEVSEWVDGLLEEGYDLSEYTWDDVVEYYVNEVKSV